MFRKNGIDRDLDTIGERELWQRFQKDNRKAFSVLFLKSYDRLYRYGMTLCGNQGQVKDSIQKLFFRLWDKRKTIKPPQSVSGYLHVSLRRILLRIRDQQKSRHLRNADSLREKDDVMLSIEQQIIVEEKREKDRQLYEQALQSLTPRQKEALQLRVHNGMSNSEISVIMGITEKRVRNLIYEATCRLRQSIYELTD